MRARSVTLVAAAAFCFASCRGHAHDHSHTHHSTNTHKHQHDHGHGHDHPHHHSHAHGHDPKDSASSSASPGLLSVCSARLISAISSLPIATAAYLSSLATAAASLAGVLLLPLPSAATGFAAVAFLAFAAGALLADTALHLLPHAYERNPSGAGYGVLAGVLVFFVMDRIVDAVSGEHGHAHGHAHLQRSTGADVERKLPFGGDEQDDIVDDDLDEDDKEDEGELNGVLTATTTSMAASVSKTRRRRPAPAAVERTPAPAKGKRGRGGKGKAKSTLKEAASPLSSSSSSHTIPPPRGVSVHAVSAAWMNLAADAVHNFCDGLSVGAAYQVSPAAGVSTTLAVFLHEVPQELGDFMLLLRGGWSRRAALAANLACALSALAGTAASLTLGAAWDAALLPFCAGGLLFMAVGAVLPELADSVRGGGAVRVALKALCAVLCAAAGVAVVRAIEAAAHEGHSHGHAHGHAH